MPSRSFRTPPSLQAKGKYRWFVPDPNKAGDLEKERERALLKEFWEYLPPGHERFTPSETDQGFLPGLEPKPDPIPRGKRIKAIRPEAVRAGFKHCWQNQDYRTIIAVAQRISEKIRQENPKLLMWHDQAVTRVGGGVDAMIKHLRIKNFKVWSDTGDIRMSPITLFFGGNSSGKSSIGQFLMMLKQTAESPDRKAVLYPGSRTTSVQLGSYSEMVFHRDASNQISFEYTWDLKDSLKFKDPLTGDSYNEKTMTFKAEVGLYGTKQSSPVVKCFEYALGDPEAQEVSIGMKRREGNKSEYSVTAQGYSLKRQVGRPWSPKTPYRFYGFPDEVVAYHQNADFVQLINLAHENFFRLISYLGPLRTKAERLYSWTGIEPEDVGFSGENTVSALLSARERKISLGFNKKAKHLEEIIASKLKEMGLIDEFSVTPISRSRQEYEVKVRTKGSPAFVDLPDVGFGVSQVLPVLVECFYARPHSIILMEQPEIHLHPSAQSALADVMIDVIKSRENGVERNIQLIIETHSEHFLRRLQRRIAEEKISQEMVSAYFATITGAKAKLEPLQLDPFGNIQNWPANFFGDEMEDVTEQARSAMNRRMAQRRNDREGS